MLTVAFRAQRGLSWELSPSSSPVLGKANGYTGNSPWDALGRQLKQVLANSCSGSDLRSSSLSILLCTSLGRVPKQVVGCVGVSAERCWLSSLDGDTWDGMKLLSLAVSSHSWNPGNPVALVMPCGKWFDTSPTHCAERSCLVQSSRLNPMSPCSCSSRNHGWGIPCPAAQLTTLLSTVHLLKALSNSPGLTRAASPELVWPHLWPGLILSTPCLLSLL